MNALLKVKEAAGKLGIHPMQLYKMVYAHKIPFIRKPGLGIRFDPEQLDRWLKEGEVPADLHQR